jgi:hypothetical protein
MNGILLSVFHMISITGGVLTAVIFVFTLCITNCRYIKLYLLIIEWYFCCQRGLHVRPMFWKIIISFCINIKTCIYENTFLMTLKTLKNRFLQHYLHIVAYSSWFPPRGTCTGFFDAGGTSGQASACAFHSILRTWWRYGERCLKYCEYVMMYGLWVSDMEAVVFRMWEKVWF